MGRSRGNPQPQLAMLVSLIGWLRRMGAPIWVLIPVVGLVLLAVLFRPAIEERLGVRLGLPGDGPAAAETTVYKPTDNSEDESGAGSSQLPDTSSDPDLRSYFTELRPKVFESPAGLRYRPGSRQGHRMRHVMAHASDVPDRPGPHGVFDADEPLEVFQLIDEAYLKAESGRDTRTRQDDGRTNHTVDMRRRIGFVGGRSGNADGRPAARKLRIILDGDYVITAYPVR